jgi:hypothetical protein
MARKIAKVCCSIQDGPISAVACNQAHSTNDNPKQHLHSFARPPIKPHLCELFMQQLWVYLLTSQALKCFLAFSIAITFFFHLPVPGVDDHHGGLARHPARAVPHDLHLSESTRLGQADYSLTQHIRYYSARALQDCQASDILSSCQIHQDAVARSRRFSSYSEVKLLWDATGQNFREWILTVKDVANVTTQAT